MGLQDFYPALVPHVVYDSLCTHIFGFDTKSVKLSLYSFEVQPQTVLYTRLHPLHPMHVFHWSTTVANDTICFNTSSRLLMSLDINFSHPSVE
jgi:hypothetical protein